MHAFLQPVLNPTTLKNAHTYEAELNYLVQRLKRIRTFCGYTATGCCLEAETGLSEKGS